LEVNIVDDANKLYVSPLGKVVHISGRAIISGRDYEVDSTEAKKVCPKMFA
jgi:hypothetical protein